MEGRPRAPVATESLAWMAFAASPRPVRLGLRVRPTERASAIRATNARRAVRAPRSASRRVARLVWIIPKAPVSVVAARTPPSTKGRVASILSATNATARTPFVSTACALVSPHPAVPFHAPTTRVSSRVQARASWASVKGLPWQTESSPAATPNPRTLNARPNSALQVSARRHRDLAKVVRRPRRRLSIHSVRATAHFVSALPACGRQSPARRARLTPAASPTAVMAALKMASARTASASTPWRRPRPAMTSIHAPPATCARSSAARGSRSRATRRTRVRSP